MSIAHQRMQHGCRGPRSSAAAETKEVNLGASPTCSARLRVLCVAPSRLAARVLRLRRPLDALPPTRSAHRHRRTCVSGRVEAMTTSQHRLQRENHVESFVHGLLTARDEHGPNVLMLDCDGVIWEGDNLEPSTRDALVILREHFRLIFCTNNAGASSVLTSLIVRRLLALAIPLQVPPARSGLCARGGHLQQRLCDSRVRQGAKRREDAIATICGTFLTLRHALRFRCPSSD